MLLNNIRKYKYNHINLYKYNIYNNIRTFYNYNILYNIPNNQIIEENNIDNNNNIDNIDNINKPKYKYYKPHIYHSINPLKTDLSTKLEKIHIQDINIISTPEDARSIVAKLLTHTSDYHAIDTEVIDLDLQTKSPINQGKCICFSIYCGNYNFGNGSLIWIDTYNIYSQEIWDIFKPYLESSDIKKIWHNYGFDRHIFNNEGIDIKGFAGDTMHMARLWDSSRLKGYSLEALTTELIDRPKRSMKDLFGRNVLCKNGEEGKQIEVPPLEILQTDPTTREGWIDYSTYDAKATWLLHQVLKAKLSKIAWGNEGSGKCMMDYYEKYWVPFGELLTDMESVGFHVNVEHINAMKVQAIIDRDKAKQEFLDWALKKSPDVANMNLGSGAQIQQLLFGEVGSTREFTTENVNNIIMPGKKKATKTLKFSIGGLGLPIKRKSKSGNASVDAVALRGVCGYPRDKEPRYGTAYEYFKGEEGKAACEAIESLIKMGNTDTLLSNFITPLPLQLDNNSRVHCSLNLNTETGRLSARRPNLQNQPGLEKDVYKIRHAFAAAPGKTLIVADYGQLELRVLAHMTRCTSMINAFKAGGDFHSRTAMSMYPYIAEAVEKKEVLLEWNSKEGKAPAPLLKDIFSSERRKAKVLNFSIAYGKTAHGLSKDWNVSIQEAKDTLDRWYADRPEVLLWQKYTIKKAHATGCTKSIMGRFRTLPEINSKSSHARSHSERAAINTPIQGGAADIVMKAMLDLHANIRFKELGWRIILQVHDEIISEGPEETAEEAFKIVKQCMCYPFEKPLLVDLIVDANIDKTWYLAK